MLFLLVVAMLLNTQLLLLPAGVLAMDTLSPRATSSVSIMPKAPASAFKPPADFVGFGFGQAWLPNYANSFSNNLIESVAARMNVEPIIRLGGTVGDLFLWNPHQKQAAVPAAGEDPDASGTTFTLGPSFFDLFSAFPNARWSWQATMPSVTNLSTTIPLVEGAWNVTGNGKLVAIALGNEVQVHFNEASVYVQHALALEQPIISALQLHGGEQDIFEVSDTLSNSAYTYQPWSL